jgi:integrase
VGEAKRKAGKRGHGEGSIRQLPSGKWQARLMVGYRPDGKPDIRSETRDTQKQAIAALRDLQRRAETGHLGDSKAGRETVGAFLLRWLDAIDGTMEPWSLRRHRNNVEQHIAPAIGHHRLAELRPEHLAGMFAALRKKTQPVRGKNPPSEKAAKALSPRTVKYVYTTIRKALDTAVDWGSVPRNVALAIKAPQVPRVEVKALKPDEVARLLASAEARGDRLAQLYAVAAFSGLRMGELLALHWGDVDMATGVVCVRRTLRGAKNGMPDYGDPKTPRSRRTFTLSADALAALRTQRARQAADRLALGADYADHGLVFPSELGTPLLESNVCHRLKAAVKRAGLPEGYTFHSLRHAAATLMLAAGVNPKVAADRLGHHSAAFTLDRYTHALEALDIDAAERIQAAMDRARRKVAEG